RRGRADHPRARLRAHGERSEHERAERALSITRLQEPLRDGRRSIRLTGGQESDVDHPRTLVAHRRFHHGATQGGGAMSDSVSRRDVVKWLASAPVGALAIGRAQRDRAIEHLRALAELGAGAPYTPKFFLPHEWRTVRVLVDY